MLTAVAYAPFPDDGFIDIQESHGVGYDAVLSGARVVTNDAGSVNVPAGSPRPGQPLSETDVSDSAIPLANSNDMELIRIEPNEPSRSVSGGGLIDLTRVLNEPVGPAGWQPTPWEESVASVATNSDHTHSLAPSEDHVITTASHGGWPGFRLTALLRKRVGMNHRPAGDKLPRLHDSPSDEIEGSRGISQAFELATSPEQAAPSSPHSHESARLPHRSDQTQPTPKPTDPGPWHAPVALRGRHLPATHEAIFDEMAKPLGDGFFDAIYLDDKRPAHVITLLAVAVLAHRLTQRNQPADAPTYLLPPRRRFAPN